MLLSWFALLAATVASDAAPDARLAEARAYVARMEARHAATGVPAFARKYGLDCTTCHWPVSPKLNGFGLRFRWRGYRMENEVGQSLKIDDVKNHLAYRATGEYAYVKAKGGPAFEDQFSLAAISAFYVGAIGKNFGAWVEVGDGDVLAQISTISGSATRYGGFRAGQYLWGAETGVAGFDRVIGASLPLPLEEPATTQAPRAFGGARLGLEGYYVVSDTRLSAGVVNGNAIDEGLGGDMRKDVYASIQHLFGGRGSGVMATIYRGSARDSAVSSGGHFLRLAASANAFLGNAELLGGVVVARDNDYLGSGSTARGLGGWGSLVYNLPESPFHRPLALTGRYEYLDQDTRSAGSRSRVLAGFAMPLTDPMYVRLRAEYTLDHFTGGGPDVHGVRVQADVVF